MICGPNESPEWFAATVGGLGLTGCITWVELQLIPVANAFMSVESRRFYNLDEFEAINKESELRWPYTVAWIDCMSGKDTRGIYMNGTHAPVAIKPLRFRKTTRRLPFAPPLLLNSISLKVFNALYFHRPLKQGVTLSHYIPYFYPLDAISNWNLIYGRKGFFQYQCVLPPDTSREGIAQLLRQIRMSGEGSFLAVLKTFGNRPSLGMLSFARPGTTLALDFPNRGEKTHRLFRELDAVLRDTGGTLYPAKDARMPSDMFRSGFPSWEKFGSFIDPKFSSSFWRRVTA
jgi:FAD/FMN-containing dehydrogenase